MADLMSKTIGMGIDQVLSYLPNVDFVALITTCRYLRGICEIEEKKRRKQSLTRGLIGQGQERSVQFHQFSHGFRYTKLPNGVIEGKFERLRGKGYSICNYENGKQIDDELVYNYLWHGNTKVSYLDLIFGDNKASSVLTKFNNWEDIDTSNMRLMNRISLKTCKGNRYIYGCEFEVPDTGEFVITLYPPVMHKRLYSSRRRYFDGQLTDTWIRSKNHIGREHHICVTNEGKRVQWWNHNEPSELITWLVTPEDRLYDGCDEKTFVDTCPY